MTTGRMTVPPKQSCWCSQQQHPCELPVHTELSTSLKRQILSLQANFSFGLQGNFPVNMINPNILGESILTFRNYLYYVITMKWSSLPNIANGSILIFMFLCPFSDLGQSLMSPYGNFEVEFWDSMKDWILSMCWTELLPCGLFYLDVNVEFIYKSEDKTGEFIEWIKCWCINESENNTDVSTVKF